MSYENIEAMYNKLVSERQSYENDIIATEDALKDSKIDYMTRKEFEDDIRYDRRMIGEIDQKLKDLADYALNNNIDVTKKGLK